MKSFRPEMTMEQAVNVLNHVEQGQAVNITPIEMGELSKVFHYDVQGESYVIHFKNDLSSLEKEQFVHNRFAPYGLPIPQVHQVGRYENLCYAIKDKVSGSPIATLEPQEIKRLVPRILDQVIRMIHIPLEDSPAGYGWISQKGEATHHTWEDYLLTTFDEEQEGFYYGWTDLYNEGILEKAFFQDMYQRMLELLPFIPQERYLVHGDYHLGNMLAHNENVTGIVDWEMAMYGDYLFDIAVMDIWYPMLQLPKQIQVTLNQSGIQTTDFDKRLRCYQLFKGLDGLRFYAKQEHEPSYQFMKNRMATWLQSP
ncbi:hypothetical protein JCM10914A_01120 [Paenibacillus sp. JCM 10914]|uniref:aminoglycoside phosphotransferase family protein n=1 Tax=Paenibacillus sp. JCM 10914 TaxID=1236974 RepID=UPI0003CC74B1|nr:aminoglycoside phosphotransferase family protein [Paenibacillus sp. JCM 10914]GAE08469.1 hypothetical protein JCM10914_4767 [Paenibacillus sp. JCM 10914]